jgi:uncharacterized membrane protein YciS (DUF1049 family)
MKFLKKLFQSLKNLITCLILVFVTIFMINNRQIVAIEFSPLPINNFETRLFVLMIIFYLAGLITAFLIYSNSLFKSFIKNLHQKRKIQKLEKEIHDK